jgi:septum site-determining protein MinD
MAKRLVYMARILTFASNKGGTGKTILVANVGVALASLGKSVAILDADIRMANLGLITGQERHKTTLHEVLAGEAPASAAVYEGPAGLKIIPCGVSMEGIRRAKIQNLKKVVQEISPQFEFLLIDSPSGLDADAITALTVAQELVIVVNPDIDSLSNALKLKLVADRIGIKSIGVAINMATGASTDISSGEISSALELPVLGTIPDDKAVRRSAALGELVVLQKPKSPAAVELKKLARAIAKGPAST